MLLSKDVLGRFPLLANTVKPPGSSSSSSSSSNSNGNNSSSSNNNNSGGGPKDASAGGSFGMSSSLNNQFAVASMDGGKSVKKASNNSNTAATSLKGGAVKGMTAADFLGDAHFGGSLGMLYPQVYVYNLMQYINAIYMVYDELQFIIDYTMMCVSS